jgi:tripartite-type tricarboxylate transporter receptor subunit TctC
MTGRIEKIAIAITVGLGFLPGGVVATTDFPSRPITLVVPFPAGGPSDT